MLARTDGAFAPAPRRLDPAQIDEASPAWQATPLPAIWPRQVLPGEAHAEHAPRSTWFDISLAGQRREAGGTWLYLPRWQTIGQIAIYGDERLLYRSNADLVWNGYNHPLWPCTTG